MSKVDEAALRNELSSDPVPLNYSSMPDATAKAAALNVVTDPPTYTKVEEVPSENARRYLELVGKWAKIVRVNSFGGASDAETEAAIALVSAIKGYTTFDLGNPQFLAAIDRDLQACVNTGLLEEANKTFLLNMKNVPCSRAVHLGILSSGDVTPGDIERAEM